MDVVVVGFPGVQGFIESGRTTADLWAASDVRSQMAAVAAIAMRNELRDGERVVFPASDVTGGAGVPNRLVAVCDDGHGRTVADRAVDAAQRFWADRLDGVETDATSRGWSIDRVPIITRVATADEYASAWLTAQQTLLAARRVRRFDGMYTSSPLGVCRACGAAPAVHTPRKLQVVVRDGERLCPVCLVKRSHRSEQRARFPSTSTIAAAPFIAEVMDRSGEPQVRDALHDLAAAAAEPCAAPMTRGSVRGIPGLTGRPESVDFDGIAFFAESWDPEVIAREAGVGVDDVRATATRGTAAVRNLTATLGAVPSSYLAVVAQDADRLGAFLGRSPTVAFHENVSKVLHDAAVAQRAALESAELLGRVVYAGGDDLLLVVPASTAIKAVLAAQRNFRDRLPGVTASSAVVFFHRSYPLVAAMRRVREALDTAKQQGRDRVALVEIRRGGERARSIVPWIAAGTVTLDDVNAQIVAFRSPMSPRIITSLAREARGLDELGRVEQHSLLARVVRRHGGDATDVERVERLSTVTGSINALVELLTVTRFVAKDGR